MEHTSRLIAAHDSRIGKLLGSTAYSLWCHMLRLASPSERHRRIEGLDQDALGEDVGLTRQQVRDALARLMWVGMVSIAKPGRFGGVWAKGLTAVYAVPAVTTARLDACATSWPDPGRGPSGWPVRTPPMRSEWETTVPGNPEPRFQGTTMVTTMLRRAGPVGPGRLRGEAKHTREASPSRAPYGARDDGLA